MRESSSERFFGLGADAEIGVGFGKDYSPFATYDISGGQRQPPTWLAVHERNIHQDG